MPFGGGTLVGGPALLLAGGGSTCADGAGSAPALAFSSAACGGSTCAGSALACSSAACVAAALSAAKSAFACSFFFLVGLSGQKWHRARACSPWYQWSEALGVWHVNVRVWSQAKKLHSSQSCFGHWQRLVRPGSVQHVPVQPLYSYSAIGDLCVLLVAWAAGCRETKSFSQNGDGTCKSWYVTGDTAPYEVRIYINI